MSVRDAPGVSLCMIVKNEEDNLGPCLESVAGLVDEMIVVDTGSTDRTKEIALRHGARVFDFPWVDDFAAARNESLRHATRKWAFWMDADDRLDEANRHKLRELFATLPDAHRFYVMRCLCLSEPQATSATLVTHVRLFRNHPQVRWEFRVHEQIVPAAKRLGGTPEWTDITICHVGYQDPALRRKKRERDLRLLQREEAERPGDPFVLFNLASICQELDRPADALPLIRRSLERSDPGDSIVRKLYAMLAQCHRDLGHRLEALTACRQGRHLYPQDAELLFQEAQALRALGDRPSALALLHRLLELPPGEHFYSVDAGVRGYLARHNLAVIYREQGKPAEAEEQWRQALQDHPGYTPALAGLGELYLAQSRWTDVEAFASRLAGEPAGQVAAVNLRGRVLLGQKEFAAALRVVDEGLARAPDALPLRVVKSHILLQEGKDGAAAERALRDILALAPNDPEARQNLGVLLRNQGRPAGP